ncbi:MAG: translational GTPase TypA [Opitutae bacterium]|nr:translational GTPase TypA [Opitutae bacterium]MBT6461352.1 translational GTPase TypA [Opitutae bacterium]MBT7853818.1 translational GTPase TypA [Opitutae bacterium]
MSTSTITSDQIRNIAIIAHVDHGKTTLVDQLLKQSGAFRENQVLEDRAMDSMDQERERGITIKAKNTSVRWGDNVINIVDTPGHADFGGEVERVMNMVDGVMLVVDAYEGPQAQTRFVLKKALAAGLSPIVFINKIDRPNARPMEMHDEVLELFLDLDANDEQFNAPFLYGSAKNGVAIEKPEDSTEGADMIPLFEAILSNVPAPETKDEGGFKMLVSNIDWSDYVGRIAIGKILSGNVNIGDTVWRLRKDKPPQRSKIAKIFEYAALATSEAQQAVAGNIVGLAGFEEVDIGETITSSEESEALPFVEIDPPTVMMTFSVNDGPYAGMEGDKVTSREIRDRLVREARTNISIKIEDTDKAAEFKVSARGSMQVAVLVEEMRREGYEILISRPTVIKRKIDGKWHEPFETLYLEVPDESVGGCMQSLANRKGQLDSMSAKNGRTFMEMTIPTRGLIGFEFEVLTLTNGEGIMSHLFKEYRPDSGDIRTRHTGTLVSIEKGEAMTYSLSNIETRGKLFVDAGEKVFEGMIIGENPRTEDLPVNPTKAKHVTNHRAAGKDKSEALTPPIRFSLERAIEYIAQDELVEATPQNIRLRKRILDSHARKRAAKKAVDEDN